MQDDLIPEQAEPLNENYDPGMPDGTISLQEMDSDPAVKLLENLVGYTGALDHAVCESTGVRFPFVVLFFGKSAAVHATNMDSAAAFDGMRQFVEQYELAKAKHAAEDGTRALGHNFAEPFSGEEQEH